MTKETNSGRKSIGDYVLLLAVPATIFLLLLITIDIIGRGVFSHSFEFSLSLEQLLLMIISFASIAATWKAGLFINIDFLVGRFSKRTQTIFRILSIIISLLCVGILFWFSIKATNRAFVGGAKTPNMDTPLGIWKAFVPFGLLVLAIELIISFKEAIKKLAARRKGGG